MRHVVHMHNAAQGHQALLRLWEVVKPWLVAGHKLRVTAEQERRNLDQNAKLHALLSDISKSLEWGGKKWDIEDWKRLLTAAWLRTRKESAVLVPAVDGQGFDVLYRRTSQLNKSECSELLDYVMAWAAEHGITEEA